MMNRKLNQKKARILIVEDKTLIANTIRFHLESKGYEVVDNAISYGEAVVLFKEQRPDLILLDVCLNGRASGIEFARFLRRQPNPPPFIFLASRLENSFIERAKETRPAGYLGKPIHAESLIASIEIALFNFRVKSGKQRSIYLKDRGGNITVPLNSIEYLRAEHVYIRFVLSDGKEVLQRGTMRQVLTRMNDRRFVQTHRGYAINTNLVTGYENDGVFIGGTKIPVSRSRRNLVLAMLEGITS